jgi:hypothetical protein
MTTAFKEGYGPNNFPTTLQYQGLDELMAYLNGQENKGLLEFTKHYVTPSLYPPADAMPRMISDNSIARLGYLKVEYLAPRQTHETVLEPECRRLARKHCLGFAATEAIHLDPAAKNTSKYIYVAVLVEALQPNHKMGETNL